MQLNSAPIACSMHRNLEQARYILIISHYSHWKGSTNCGQNRKHRVSFQLGKAMQRLLSRMCKANKIAGNNFALIPEQVGGNSSLKLAIRWSLANGPAWHDHMPTANNKPRTSGSQMDPTYTTNSVQIGSVPCPVVQALEQNWKSSQHCQSRASSNTQTVVFFFHVQNGVQTKRTLAW